MNFLDLFRKRRPEPVPAPAPVHPAAQIIADAEAEDDGPVWEPTLEERLAPMSDPERLAYLKKLMRDHSATQRANIERAKRKARRDGSR